MPLNPDASPPPRKDRGEPLGMRRAIEPAAPSMYVASLGTSRIYVTYALPIAIAASVVLVMLVRQQPNVGDVATAFLIGGAFWVGGCLVQVVSHLAVWGVWNEPCESVTVGLLGVEFPPVHQRPRKLIALAIATVTPLILAAIASTMVGVVWADEPFWLASERWSMPSLGDSTSDHIWQAGGLLLVVQMICQFFPLPRTPGRQVVLALTAEALRHLDLPQILVVARRMLVLIAVILAMVALAIMPLESGSVAQRWPILLVVSVMLWVSSRSEDVELSLWSLVNSEAARRGPATPRGTRHSSTWLRGQMQNLRSLKGRRRLRQAIAKERSEAVDASKLDEILAKLHEQGESSLTPDERAILRRVSETLRKRDE